jgi:hypothetical protein
LSLPGESAKRVVALDDPAIRHASEQCFFLMDARVKPAHDER